MNLQEQEAKFERAWLVDPQQFNPNRSARTQVENERLLEALPLMPGKKALDLGCGFGKVAEALQKGGMIVDAVDIANNALKRLQLPQVNLIQTRFPYTKLSDNTYSLIVASNLIAEIPEKTRRLALSEISRLLTPDGLALLSTPIDITSEDAAARFLSLIETELEIDSLIPSYHALSIQFPFFKHSRPLLSLLESLGHFLYHNQALSHLIVLAHRRPLNRAETPVVERKTKKSVWE